MLDFWGIDPSIPTASALNQQRAKLKPDALEAVFKQFNCASATLDSAAVSTGNYRFLAADGSTCTFFSTPSFAPDEYYCSPAHSAKGFYSMHLNAFFDLDSHTYTDALIQAVHSKNEFGAFCTMVDRHGATDGTQNVYIGDRGYCSYNNMAHVINQNQFFLFRTKDIHSKGLVGNFDFPDEDPFDIRVKVTLVRTHSKKALPDPPGYVRFVDQASTFDFIEYGSHETYGMEFRIVRFHP